MIRVDARELLAALTRLSKIAQEPDRHLVTLWAEGSRLHVLALASLECALVLGEKPGVFTKDVSTLGQYGRAELVELADVDGLDRGAPIVHVDGQRLAKLIKAALPKKRSATMVTEISVSEPRDINAPREPGAPRFSAPEQVVTVRTGKESSRLTAHDSDWWAPWGPREKLPRALTLPPFVRSTTHHASLELDASVWGPLLAFVLPFASKDEARVNLTKIALFSDGRLIATDGHRLAQARTPKLPARFFGGRKVLLLPAEVVQAIIAAKHGALTVSWSARAEHKHPTHWTVARANASTMLGLPSAPVTFPPVDKVLRGEHWVTVRANIAELRHLLRQAAVVHATTRHFSSVRVLLRPDRIQISAVEEEGIEFKGHMDVLDFAVHGTDDPFHDAGHLVALNGDYVDEALEALARTGAEFVTLGFLNDPIAPVCCTAGDFTIITMPMKLNP